MGALAPSDLTPTEAFYVRSHGPVPDHAGRLVVDGLVERPLSLSLAELAAFEVRDCVATLQCAGNRRAELMAVRDIPGEIPWGPGAIGTASWRGVPLADVLRAAGVQPGARHIELLADGYEVSIPLHKALAGEALLAWEMNGAPLTPDHGAPLRMVVPGYIGARSVKWLTGVRALAEPSQGYYQAVAYRLDPGSIALGAVAVNADILTPGPGEVVPAGELEIVGYAFAGDDRGIVRVDVSCDAGASWRQAELLQDLGPWAWDSAAATQPEDAAAIWNPGGYANNSWARVEVSVASSSG